MSKTLDDFVPGESGYITKINCEGPVKRRFVDMGLVAGTLVKVLKYAPLGDPIEIKVKNYNLALRKAEAVLIEVAVD